LRSYGLTNTAPLRAKKVRRTPDKSSTDATNGLLILIGPNKTKRRANRPCVGTSHHFSGYPTSRELTLSRSLRREAIVA
jgi:hypothetical protein